MSESEDGAKEGTAGRKDHFVGLQLFILAGNGDIEKLLLVPDVSEYQADISFKIVPRKTKLFRIGHCCSFLGALSESDSHFDADWWGLKKPAARLSLAAGSVRMLKHPAFNYLSLQYQHHLKADQSRNTSQCRVSMLRCILP